MSRKYYKPKTKEKPEAREDIIKQNKEKFDKMIYDLKHDGILLSDLKEAKSVKLGGSNNPKLGCVYKITCLEDNKIYIGSTNDFVKRFTEHLNDLIGNKHTNRHLQNAYNLKGPNKFKVTLVEEIPYEENKYNNYEDYLNCIREKEQYYLDKLDCYNHKIGYNMSKKADTVYVSTEMLFEDKKLKFTKEFILEICNLMMDTRYNLREIAEMKNVKFSLIKDINQHRAYREITKDYNFPERNNKKLWTVFEGKKEEIYKLYHEGFTCQEIAEKMNLKLRDVEHLFSFATIPQPIYIYNIKRELLNIFYMPQTCAKFLDKQPVALAHTLVQSDKNNGVAFIQGREDIIISRKFPAPEFSPLEQYLGKYINPTWRPIFKYDKNYREIEEVYYNSKEVEGYKKNTINLYCAQRKHGWSNFKSTPKEDIDKFLIKKGINIKEN